MKQKIVTFTTRLYDFFVNYFSLSGQLVSQAEAEANIREGVSFRGTNILILVMAIFIASLGLNTNSPAVIIGAMLISPLMGPIIGIGLAVGIHDFDLLKRCVRNLIMAAGFSVIASTLYFLISPVNEQHSELLARTSPTIYDVLIGFFGGGAGIIALGSTNKGNVLPGVAIATALMPPLCTAGYGIATWQPHYFLGAGYLFVINSIYIAFATFIGVKLMKYHGNDGADTVRARRVRRIVYTLAVLTMLPSIYLTYNMLQTDKFQHLAGTFVREECRFPDTQVLSQSATVDHGERTIQITLIGRVLPADSLRMALDAKLRYYGLEGTHLDIVQGATPAASASEPAGIADIYNLAQTTITRQQSDIDSLRALLAARRSAAMAGPEITPEVRVLFPNITEIGISTTVMAATIGSAAGSPAIADSSRLDTTTVALIRATRPLSEPERTRLRKYLQARLNTPHITVVTL